MTAPSPLPPSACRSRLRRGLNVAAGVVLATAGAITSVAGFVPLAAVFTMAGTHLIVQEAGTSLGSSRWAQRLNRSSIRRKEFRHLGELTVSAVLGTAGVLLALGGLPQLGAPCLVAAVDIAVHAVSAIHGDIAEERAQRRARHLDAAAPTATGAAPGHAERVPAGSGRGVH